jgi:hypothetical protein
MRRFPIVILAAVVLVSFNACENGGTTQPPPPYEIISLIESIELSFNIRDIEDLEVCLASDFIFCFDPKDVGEETGEYIIPESWTRDQFIDIVGYIFDVVYSIDLKIDTSVIHNPITDDKTYTAADVPVRFLIMIDPVSGFLAQGTFTFELRAEYDRYHRNYWYVTTWRDFTGLDNPGERNIVPASFGVILANFR